MYLNDCRCPSANGTEEIVSIYQNERKVAIPKCVSNPCTLQDLKQCFNDVFDEDKCNLKFCHVSETLKSSSTYPLFLSSSVLVFYLTIVTYFM